jgi:hypothetical protein
MSSIEERNEIIKKHIMIDQALVAYKKPIKMLRIEIILLQ